MPKGIIGRKIGMTQVFTPTGECIPVSVIQAGPCTVIRKKTPDSKDAYAAIVLGFEEARSCEYNGETVYKLNKPKLGLFTKNNLKPQKILKEIRLSESDLDKYEQGQEINATLFNKGEKIDVIGTSKGRGFAGVMKRHNFGGTKASHGVHEFFRHGGSIGCSATPGRTVKGRKMAGQYGNTQVSIQNLTIHDIIPDQNLILVKGSIPGHNGSLVIVSDAAKLRRRSKNAK